MVETVYFQNTIYTQTIYVYLRAGWRVEHGGRLEKRKSTDYLNSKEDVMKA